jgi:hypothetical protein
MVSLLGCLRFVVTRGRVRCEHSQCGTHNPIHRTDCMDHIYRPRSRAKRIYFLRRHFREHYPNRSTSKMAWAVGRRNALRSGRNNAYATRREAALFGSGTSQPCPRQACPAATSIHRASRTRFATPTRTWVFDDHALVAQQRTPLRFGCECGTTNSGWPVVLNARRDSAQFSTRPRKTAGAGADAGHYVCDLRRATGDCGTVFRLAGGVPLNNPANVRAWATTRARRLLGNRRSPATAAPFYRHGQYF